MYDMVYGFKSTGATFNRKVSLGITSRGANDITVERIEVLRDSEIIISRYTQILNNTKGKWNYFADIKSLSKVPFAIEPIKKALLDAKARSTRIKFVTEITKQNINFCRQIMELADLRHLDGVRGNFGVSDTEYIAVASATTNLTESNSSSTTNTILHAVYSNAKDDIQQQQYIFDTFWNKAIPAEQRIRQIQEGHTVETTEVLYGTDEVIHAELSLFSKAKVRLDTCMDYTRPPLAVAIEPIRKAFVEAKSKGVKLRYLSEITSENMSSCKEIMKIVDEFRHLDGVKTNFMISESEYAAPATSHEMTRPATTIILSNVKEIVEQQQYVFNTFWNKAVPAEQRIREIEEGSVHYETRIIEGSQEIIREISRITDSSNQLDSCLTPGGMQYSYNHFFEIEKKLLKKQKNGEHRGIRYISNIDKDNAKLAKIFLDAGIQMRHVKTLPPMSFGVSDKEIAATIEKMEGGRMVQSLLLSNETAYVNHFNSIFEELWKNGTDAVERIKDVEVGADLADIEVIQSSSRAREVYLNLVKSASKEILLVFATTGAFIRQQKMGVIRYCQEAVEERNVRVRILMPSHESTAQTILYLKENYPEHFDVRYIEQTSGTKATILLVDQKISLVMELRDDSKGTFDEAIGLSTYSNSRSGVLSYVSIFENLWVQTELYKQVKEANERLRLHDKMQQEFINVAAHELRTPIQPILTVVGVLHSTKGHIDQDKWDNSIDLIQRNAKRLKRLAEDILDVTKIESQSLILNKERLNLNDVISNAIQDTKNQIEYTSNGVQILYYKPDDIIFLEADRYRVTQVVTNLLDNAVKFVKGYNETVSVSIEKKKDVSGDQETAVVSVKDTGTGIDPDIFPRLFEKFASKSFKGTGLGLFICKSIVEAHGGRIWAENNRGVVGEKGATFYFTLPITNSSRK